MSQGSVYTILVIPRDSDPFWVGALQDGNLYEMSWYITSQRSNAYKEVIECAKDMSATYGTAIVFSEYSDCDSQSFGVSSICVNGNETPDVEEATKPIFAYKKVGKKMVAERIATTQAPMSE